jgi:RHS repeat-associated protein
MDVTTVEFVGVEQTISLTQATRTLGNKQYEITNHLGNVLAVITDRKLPYAPFGTANQGVIHSYYAQLISVTDYTAFGVALEGRTWSDEGYRYGFNGIEVSDVTINQFDADFRSLDPKLGRWLSPDPYQFLFSDRSPFEVNFNNPIFFSDILGLAPNDPIKVNGNDDAAITNALPANPQDGQTETLDFGSSKLDENGKGITGERVQYNAERGLWVVTEIKSTWSQDWDSGSDITDLDITFKPSDNSAPVNFECDNLNKQQNQQETILSAKHNLPQQNRKMKRGTSAQKAADNKIRKVTQAAGQVNSGAGLVSNIVQTAAEQTLKDNYRYGPPSSGEVKSLKFISKISKWVGKVTGYGSAVLNATDAISKFHAGNTKGAIVSGLKAIGDIALTTVLKANPIGLAVSIGWGIISNFWD